jgi:hypothetical protein
VKLRKQFEQQMAQKDGDFAKREAKLRRSQQALVTARGEIDNKIARKLEMERVSISKSESQKARTAHHRVGLAIAADDEPHFLELRATAEPEIEAESPSVARLRKAVHSMFRNACNLT